MTNSLCGDYQEYAMSIYEPIASSDARRHLQLRSPVTMEPTGELVCANAESRG